MPVPAKPLLNKGALTLVIIMTALLVLALSAVVWGFVKQARVFMAAKAGHAAAAPAGNAAATVTLAPGARIISASTDSGKLVLHVSTPSGGEVEIIDLATGKLTAQVKTH